MRASHYEKGPGRDRRRKGRRQRQQAVTAGLCVFVLLLSALLLAAGFFPEKAEQAINTAKAGYSVITEQISGAVGSIAGKETGTKPGEDGAGTGGRSDGEGEPVFPSGEGLMQEAPPEIEVQNIVIPKETETPPETEAPPKYTEDENTRLIRRNVQPQEDASGSGGASAAEVEAGQALVTLSFAGDILFDDRYAIMASVLQRSGGVPDIETAFDKELLSLMRGADVFLVNNEFPYSKRGTPLAEKKFTFRADPAYASLLTDMGVDIAALANNHMYDHGEEALLDTLDTLQALSVPAPGTGSTGPQDGRKDGKPVTAVEDAVYQGLPYIGAGRNLEEASAPFYFTDGNIKIGFVCATQIERMGNPDTKGATESSAGVFRCLNSKNLVEKIGQMKTECDFVVAYLHWGTESTDQVDEHQLKLAKEAVQAGADLIIGDHPHVLQKIDLIDGVPVVYSLGNFLFNSGAQDTCLVTASLDSETAELISLQFIPARQEGCKTRLLTGSEQTRVIEYMRSISDVSIDDEGFVKVNG